MRNPAGDSKGYAFVEFALPGAAAACKEAWNKAGEAQRPQAQRDAAGGGAEPGRAVSGHAGGVVERRECGMAGILPACCWDESASAGPRQVGSLSCHLGPCSWVSSPPLPPTPPSAVPAYQRVKLQRAEGAPIKTLPGLFATVLYVDNLSTVSLVWGQPLLECLAREHTAPVAGSQVARPGHACLAHSYGPLQFAPLAPPFCTPCSPSTSRTRSGPSFPSTARWCTATSPGQPPTHPAPRASPLWASNTPSLPTRECRAGLRWQAGSV